MALRLVHSMMIAHDCSLFPFVYYIVNVSYCWLCSQFNILNFLIPLLLPVSPNSVPTRPLTYEALVEEDRVDECQNLQEEDEEPVVVAMQEVSHMQW